jgi:hypothetical protein
MTQPPREASYFTAGNEYNARNEDDNAGYDNTTAINGNNGDDIAMAPTRMTM